MTLLLPELGVALDAQLATVLMAGIVQDTHTFAHPNATRRTLRVAAQLVEAGGAAAGHQPCRYADRRTARSPCGA